MRGASVTGHAGWRCTELSVLGGYRRRVTAICCCRPGTAGIVIGPLAAGQGRACQTDRPAGASAAWGRTAGVIAGLGGGEAATRNVVRLAGAGARDRALFTA